MNAQLSTIHEETSSAIQAHLEETICAGGRGFGESGRTSAADVQPASVETKIKALLIPKPDEILLDLDYEEDVQNLSTTCERVLPRIAGVRALDIRTWRSKKNWHACIRLNASMSSIARIALAGALGDDPLHVMAGVREWLKGSEKDHFLTEHLPAPGAAAPWQIPSTANSYGPLHT